MQFIDERPNFKPPSNDFALIHFNSYEDYLDSLYDERDKCFLQSTEMCRMVAEFGFKKDSKTLSRKEFYQKRSKVQNYLSPVEPNVLASAGFKSGDPAQNALALRERANRVGIITTIIFVSYYISKDREISGYIDYAHSLLKKDWKKFFKENKPIYPNQFDLGYYDWKKNITVVNNSMYYKTLMMPKKGLVLQNKYDRMLIVLDPFNPNPGQNTSRTRIKSKMYNACVLIDHMLRCRK